MICILWTRLGTPLPKQIRRPDGTRYASGTEFEVEDALAGDEATRNHPDLWIYRRSGFPRFSLGDSELLARHGQMRALDQFLNKTLKDSDGSLKAAFHTFDGPAQFEEKLEEHLRKWLESRASGPDASEAGLKPTWFKPPFQGLSVFDSEHQPIFFGRTAQSSAVLDRLRRQAAAGAAFVLVTGMSGVGKSSLVRAGASPC